MTSAIVDSDLNLEEALAGLHPECPPGIRSRQCLVDVRYRGFDDRLHVGQMIVDERLASDIVEIFALALETKFPIHSVIPISAERFRRNGRWDDVLSMEANNSSGFNYRLIAGTDRMSLHAYGWAVDINPRQNPFIKNGVVQPHGAVHDPTRPGTFADGHPIVAAFEERSWTWGGRWSEPRDYHHFQKRPDD